MVDDASVPRLVRSLPARIGWLALGVGFLVHLRRWPFLCDDAYISFRYARNFARHGSLVFNVDPIEYVEGYTNPLWVVLLGVGDWLGISPPTLAPFLTALASALSLVLVVWLVRSLRESLGPTNEFGLLDFVPALWLVALPEFVVWGSGGLETSFALALTLGSMVGWVRGRIVPAAGLAAAAGLTRPDSLLLIACFGIAWLVVMGLARLREGGGLRANELPWRRLSVALLVFAGPLVLHLLWRHAYYGEWLPNTWAIKKHGALLADTSGTAYLTSWVENVRLYWLVLLVPLLRLRHVIVIFPAVAMAIYVRSVGGDFMAYSRFLLPATALVGALVGWLLADFEHWFRRRMRRPAPVGLVVGLVLAGGLAAQVPARVALDEEKAWIPARRGDERGRWEGVRGMDEFARVRVAAGEWMRQNLPPDTLVTVGAAGAMPYASELPTFDAYGLVDPGVLEVAEPQVGKGARPGHQLHAPLKYMKSREPDLMCHIGYADKPRPKPAWARQRAGRNYTWACVEVGQIEDRRGEVLDAGYYCCVRERDHVVGPFGAEEGGAGT